VLEIIGLITVLVNKQNLKFFFDKFDILFIAVSKLEFEPNCIS